MEQSYFFAASQLAVALAAASLGAWLAFRGSARILVALFGVWALACLACFLVPNPIGVAITRPRYLLLPLILLAAALAGFRPRLIAAGAVVLALAYGVLPYRDRIRSAIGARSDNRAFWAPAIGFLRQRSSPDFRVEVVSTGAHWESYYLPRAGLAMARGWYRQVDVGENELLYGGELSPRAYRSWLRGLGVRYVLLPRLGLDSSGADQEAKLLRSGRSGLVRVSRTPGWVFYELPNATPILSGPGRATITAFGHDLIAGRAEGAGTYRLRVRHMPYWRVARGAVSITRSGDGTILLRVSRPGSFRLETGL